MGTVENGVEEKREVVMNLSSVWRESNLSWGAEKTKSWFLESRKTKM